MDKQTLSVVLAASCCVLSGTAVVLAVRANTRLTEHMSEPPPQVPTRLLVEEIIVGSEDDAFLTHIAPGLIEIVDMSAEQFVHVAASDTVRGVRGSVTVFDEDGLIIDNLGLVPFDFTVEGEFVSKRPRYAP